MPQELIGAEVTHQTYLERLANGQANDVVAYLERAADYIRGRLTRTKTLTNSNLPKVLADVEAQLDLIYSGYTDDLEFYFKELAQLEIAFQVELIGGFVDRTLKAPATKTVIDRAYRIPMTIGNNQSAVTLRSMVNSYVKSSTFIKSGAVTSQVDRVLSAIVGGQAQGLTTDEIVRNIVGTRSQPGILNQTRRDTTTITRTATNHIATQSKAELFKQNDDITVGYRWISTLDSRTSGICRSRDNQVYLNSDSFKPYPPAHYSCRSAVIPELAEEYQIPQGTRASKGDGGGAQVPAGQQYYTFLKNQNAEFQDDVLGPTLGKAFRNSGLSPQEFRAAVADRLGNPLTLEEIRAKDDRLARYLRNG